MQCIHCAGQNKYTLKKLEFWKICLRSSMFECFPLLHELIVTNTLIEIRVEIILHHSQLSDELTERINSS